MYAIRSYYEIQLAVGALAETVQARVEPQQRLDWPQPIRRRRRDEQLPRGLHDRRAEVAEHQLAAQSYNFV